MASKKTKVRKTATIIGVIVLILLIIAALIVFPRTAKAKVDLWTPYDELEAQVLTKEAGKDYKILQLTDTQLWSKSSDNKATLKLVKDIVEKVQPDFIVHTGDNVSGLFTDMLLKNLIDTMNELGVPWASVYGNHDREGRATLNWQDAKLMESEKGMFVPGPSNVSGHGNYAINLEESGKVLQSLIFLDSHAGVTYNDGEGGNAYITADQIMWYEWVIKELTRQNDGKIVPSMMFYHIPIPEYEKALYPFFTPGDEIVRLPEDKGFGLMSEGISAPRINSGLFDKAKELGSTKEMFVGHDHANSATIVYEGIRLSYGVKTGPSPAPWNDATEYGGKLITVKDGTNKIEIENIVMETLDPKS